MSEDPAPLFTAEQATALVPRRALGPARAYFTEHGGELQALLQRWFPGWDRVVCKENPDNLGLYFLRSDAPVPFLWLGLGWGADDPPERLPSWGASLEVNQRFTAAFWRGDAGLRAACEQAARAGAPELGLHRFAGHAELATWRPFEWLLAAVDQRVALAGFWAGTLAQLGAAGVPEAAAAFAQALLR